MNALDPRIAEALARLPSYLGAHIVLSVSALALGLILSFPLALLGVRSPRWRAPLLTVASIVQTIPGLALLALFYPLLLALSLLTQSLVSVQFSALGFLPSLLALALYSMLPVLRNTVTGLLGVDAAAKEAAQGVGMTARQSLFQVELPLALPVIIAGIRTASVWVIGTATLSTAVGQTSLGNYIFTGLQTQNWIFVLFGCVAAALLALAADGALAMMERALVRRQRRRLALIVAAALLLVGTAVLLSLVRGHAAYTIGAKGFAEQYVLASLIEQRLADAGLSAVTRGDLGSAVIFDALAAGDIDVYVDYSGTLWANAMKRSDVPPRETLLSELGAWLQQTRGVTMLGPLGFENAYVLAMRRERAEALGLHSIADLAAVSPGMTIGGDVEIFGRPEWKALQTTYGLAFRQRREMQPTFLYKAAADGEADVITAFSSDGRIAEYDLVTLGDPKRAIPPYDAVLLISPQHAGDAVFLAALKPLVGAISIERMREANLAVSRAANQLSPDEAARRLSAALRGAP